jgi:hypothetical protein
MSITRHRLLGLTVALATAATVISAGASAVAATGGPHGNYRGPAQPVRPAAASTRGTNYRGTAKTPPRAAGPAAAAHAAAGTVTRYYSLAGSAFTPDGLHNTTEDYFNEWDPATLSNQDNGRCFDTGLSLPANATLKSVTVFYTAGSAAMYFEINQQDLATHTAAELVTFDSTINTGTPTYTATTETFPAASAQVHMATYAYSAGACPNGNTTFSGLTIKYTQPAG